MNPTLCFAIIFANLFMPVSVFAVEPKPGEVVEVEIGNGVKMKFCWIPAGEAQLGSPKAEQDYITKTIFDGKRWDKLDKETETARGNFKTKGFWLGKYAVTQKEWLAVVGGKNPSYFVPTQDNLMKEGIKDTSRFPVECVSGKEIDEKFLKQLNKAAKVPTEMVKGKFVLPHEDEWEYACRGGLGNKQAFYFGNVLNGDKANCNGTRWPYGTFTKGVDSNGITEVGSYENKAPHPWGLCDMSGNVFQWCENQFDNKPDDRVTRGGAWAHFPISCRSAHRHWNTWESSSNDTGFRVCFRLE